jgi:hypothetical protein
LGSITVGVFVLEFRVCCISSGLGLGLRFLHPPLNSSQRPNLLPKKEFRRRVHGEVEEEGEEVCGFGPAASFIVAAVFFGFAAVVVDNDPNQSISSRLRCS